MPAPKQFKSGPQTIREDAPHTGAVVTKGRYSTVPTTTPIIDDPAVVEIAVDDVTIVMEDTSKYVTRSFHAYGEVGDDVDEEAEVLEEVVPEPVSPEGPVFGEWRSDSTLEGSHYHRKDSRLR